MAAWQLLISGFVPMQGKVAIDKTAGVYNVVSCVTARVCAVNLAFLQMLCVHPSDGTKNNPLHLVFNVTNMPLDK